MVDAFWFVDEDGEPLGIVQTQDVITSPCGATEPSVNVVDAPMHGAVDKNAAVGNPPMVNT